MLNKAKIAVLVSGGGTNLQALIDAERSGIINSGSIALVLSNKPGVYALERAANAGIESCVINKKECSGSEDFESRIIDALDSRGIDIIVLAGFMCILSVKVSGATVHFVNEIPDGGKIIMQKAVEVKDGDTPEILQKRIMEEAEWKILPLSCEQVCRTIVSERNK